ncbi:MAG: metal ABC transporter substrate-binding protein [Nitrospiria bacterium]
MKEKEKEKWKSKVKKTSIIIIMRNRAPSNKKAASDRIVSKKGILSGILILTALSFSWGCSSHGRTDEIKVNVVTTLPVLKDFVEQIGQNRVAVATLLTGMESEHTYTPKPSDILSVKKAEILVQIGLGLEVWVQGLISNAENGNLLVITTSNGIPLIREEETPVESGDTHPHEGGNPHIWLDPENAKNMVRTITDGLIKIDPSGKEFYLKNQGIYLMRLDGMETSLLKELKTIRNKTVIAQHPAWPYFARRFGFKVAGNIMTQIGSEPSAKQVKDLINLIRKNHIRVIIAEPQLSPKIPQVLASETGAKLVTLSPLTGAIPGTETYISLIEYNVHQIIEAIKLNK